MSPAEVAFGKHSNLVFVVIASADLTDLGSLKFHPQQNYLLSAHLSFARGTAKPIFNVAEIDAKLFLLRSSW